MQNQRFFLVLKTLLLVAILYSVSPTFAAESKNLPLIGIAMDYETDKTDPKKIKTFEVYSTYVDAVSKAGGIPVLLPPMDDVKLKQIFDKLDGVVLVGGADYPSSYYNEPKHETADEMHPVRADFDLRLAKMALADKYKPVLGICAGCQILNIAAGGSLIQDIPSHVKDGKTMHRRPASYSKTVPFKHNVKIDKESRLGKIYQVEQLQVPTSHHQCVNKVANKFTVVARADDGMTEAIEADGEDKFLFGVQWHPERDYESNHKLWETFVKECSLFRKKLYEKLLRKGDPSNDVISPSQP
ncbi:MAG: gamma-glutamyl-gamma-aminobutyrate hydrolase family protein [Candidatus Melainabacteria bacterium]|nr:MAG: gamma-glutamyl-gamma-aminobutyrate hydrolase family protein [Candidatus Melainabacteria bacterium]